MNRFPQKPDGKLEQISEEISEKGKTLNSGIFAIRFLLLSLPFLVSSFFMTLNFQVLASTVIAVILEYFRHKHNSIVFWKFLLLVWLLDGVLVFGSFTAPKAHPLDLAKPLPYGLSAGPKVLLDVGFGKINWRDEFAGIENKFPDSHDIKTTVSPRQPVAVKKASVIFAAHGEHKYIERTIASIYANTPLTNLQEIILIDDASDPPLEEIVGKFWEKLKNAFDEEMTGHVNLKPGNFSGNFSDLLPPLIYKRHETQEGLIRSKTHGASIASGDVIVFLDAHVNAEPNWLPPMLRMIAENYKRVVVPLIPILDGETWEIKEKGVGIKMMFSWSLAFNWFDDGNDFVPVMSGGLLAMHRRWWFESGQYDTGMMLWGAENIEQSLRVWLCGGEIMVSRESRVSHVFRPHFPYPINDTQVMINKARLVETWFDEYKENVYNGEPHLRKYKDITGDISERLKLKQDLHCQPFDWFVERFRPVFKMKGMLDEHISVIQETNQNRCVMLDGSGFKLVECNNMNIHQRFSTDGDAVRIDITCFDVNAGEHSRFGKPVLAYRCNDSPKGVSESQKWRIENGMIKYSGKTPTEEICVGIDVNLQLVYKKCAELPNINFNLKPVNKS